MSAASAAFRAPSGDEITHYKRIATEERAAAITAAWRAINGWLGRGVALRYQDDAFTHPAAGPLCGC